jgi:hypothetical protein
MKNLKSILLITFCVVLSIAKAQNEAPKAVLSDADIDLFIKTYKPLSKDLEKLGDKYDDISDPTVKEAFRTSNEVQAIFEKHGWNNDYYSKFSAIMMCFAFIQIDEELAKLSEEDRKMMAPYLSNYTNQINNADIKKVKTRIKELEVVLTED